MTSGRVLHVFLFLALFLLAPLPFLLMEWGFAPALRIVMLTGILGTITLADGFSEITRIMLPIIAVQAVLYPLLLWWSSARVLRVITAQTSAVASVGFVAGVTLILLVLSSFDVYVTLVSSASRHSSWVQILD